MNNNELLEKLKKLKEIKLDSGWKSRTREVLFSQVSNSVAILDVPMKKRASFWFKKVLSFSCQPAAIALGVFAIFAFGIFGAQASKNIKPDNYFYTARILSEKAQLAVTFDEEKKEKLNVKLASTRAKDITDILSNTDLDKEENKKKVEKLAGAFKSEINNVKSGLENLNRIKEEKVAVASVEVEKTISKDDVAVGLGSINKEDDSKVYVVEADKGDKGLEIYTGVDVKAPDAIVPATSTVENLPQATTSQSFDSNVARLNEVDNSFDFATAKQILEQVNNLIENIDNKDVKIETPVATSAPVVITASTTTIATTSTTEKAE
ncbi:MAG: DUF5667 domain-containing protein [Patescibacteria group bacterium]